jgi:hypothetical protein
MWLQLKFLVLWQSKAGENYIQAVLSRSKCTFIINSQNFLKMHILTLERLHFLVRKLYRILWYWVLETFTKFLELRWNNHNNYIWKQSSAEGNIWIQEVGSNGNPEKVMHGRDDKCTQIWKLKLREHLRDLGTNGRIILNKTQRCRISGFFYNDANSGILESLVMKMNEPNPS